MIIYFFQFYIDYYQKISMTLYYQTNPLNQQKQHYYTHPSGNIKLQQIDHTWFRSVLREFQQISLQSLFSFVKRAFFTVLCFYFGCGQSLGRGSIFFSYSLESLSDSRLSSTQKACFSTPLGQMILPGPFLLPFFHPPSYLLPSSQQYTPNPSFLSSQYAPTYLLPSLHLYTPYPCIMLFFHSPSQLLPSICLQKPLPSILPYYQSPSQADPSAHSNTPFPCLKPFLNCPLQILPSTVDSSPQPDGSSSFQLPLQTSPFCFTYFPSPSALLSAQLPSQQSPLGCVNLPCPLGLLSTHCPTQIALSGQVWVPKPFLIPRIISPWQVIPDGNLMIITLSSHFTMDSAGTSCSISEGDTEKYSSGSAREVLRLIGSWQFLVSDLGSRMKRFSLSQLSGWWHRLEQSPPISNKYYRDKNIFIMDCSLWDMADHFLGAMQTLSNCLPKQDFPRMVSCTTLSNSAMSLFMSAAASWSRGSSRSAALMFSSRCSRPMHTWYSSQMGFHPERRMERQTLPFLSMLGWRILLRHLISGGLKGYSSVTLKEKLMAECLQKDLSWLGTILMCRSVTPSLGKVMVTLSMAFSPYFWMSIFMRCSTVFRLVLLLLSSSFSVVSRFCLKFLSMLSKQYQKRHPIKFKYQNLIFSDAYTQGRYLMDPSISSAATR